MEYQKENKYYVYAISDPVNRVPFYIGKGCGNRAYSHLKGTELNADKNKIINLLKSIGILPRIDFIIENLDEKTAYEIEYYIIKNAKNYNINLTNKVGIRNPPSRKGIKLSEETKLKISKSTKGKFKKPMSNETKLKLSEINKGKIGPNKKIITDIVQLKLLYIDKNKTKKEVCEHFNIGLGSLNRILKENNIKKTKENFSDYSSRKLSEKTLIYK